MESTNFEMPTSSLYRGIAAVNVSKGKDATRPIICSILFEFDQDDTVRLVATDSYRMAVADLSNVGPIDCESFGIEGDLKALIAFLKAAGSTTTVSVGEKQITFESTNGQVFVDRSLAGNFPDYRQLIAADFQAENCMVGYNPAFLSDIGKAANLFTRQTAKNAVIPVRINHNGANKPGRFRVYYNDDTLDQWLMPVRVA